MATLTAEAIEVLEKVKASIREEPRRLRMTTWIAAKSDESGSWDLIPRKRRPRCGRAYCIGGGIELFSGQMPHAFLNPNDNTAIAVAILELFTDFPESGRIPDTGPWKGERYATAPAACRAIDRFIAEFAPQQGGV